MIDNLNDLLAWEKKNNITVKTYFEYDKYIENAEEVKPHFVGIVDPYVLFERVKLIGGHVFVEFVDSIMMKAFHSNVDIREYMNAYIKFLNNLSLLELMMLQNNGKRTHILPFASAINTMLVCYYDTTLFERRTIRKSFINRAFDRQNVSLLERVKFYKAGVTAVHRCYEKNKEYSFVGEAFKEFTCFYHYFSMFDPSLILKLVEKYFYTSPKELKELFTFEFPVSIMKKFGERMENDNSLKMLRCIYNKLLEYGHESAFDYLFSDVVFNIGGEIGKLTEEQLLQIKTNFGWQIETNKQGIIKQTSFNSVFEENRWFYNHDLFDDYFYTFNGSMVIDDVVKGTAIAKHIFNTEMMFHDSNYLNVGSDYPYSTLTTKNFNDNFGVVRSIMQHTNEWTGRYYQAQVEKDFGIATVIIMLINQVVNFGSDYNITIDHFIYNQLDIIYTHFETSNFARRELSRILGLNFFEFIKDEKTFELFKRRLPETYKQITLTPAFVEFIIDIDKIQDNATLKRLITDVKRISLKTYNNLIVNMTSKIHRFDEEILDIALSKVDFKADREPGFIFNDCLYERATTPTLAYYLLYPYHKVMFEEVTLNLLSKYCSGTDTYLANRIKQVVERITILSEAVGFAKESEIINENIEKAKVLVHLKRN